MESDGLDAVDFPPARPDGDGDGVDGWQRMRFSLLQRQAGGPEERLFFVELWVAVGASSSLPSGSGFGAFRRRT